MTKKKNRAVLATIGAIWLIFISSAWAEDLQRLFTTPEERIELNWIRDNPTEIIPKAEVKEEIKKKVSSEEAPRYITFNGIIIQGKNTPLVWVNNSHNLIQTGFRVELQYLQGNLLPIYLISANRLVVLKPGQTLDTVDGKILEAYEITSISPESLKSTTRN